ncbi:hypothetical protein EBU95_21045, partial [bacterium]|nr:hypothetical protein [bacterium]
TAPEKELNIPSVDVSFTFKSDDLASVLKNASLLQSPHIAFESDGDAINVTTFNADDDSAHINATEIAEGNGKSFKAVFMTDNLKLMSNTYEVEISSKGLASFKSEDGSMQYWIAIEAKHSKFGE